LRISLLLDGHCRAPPQPRPAGGPAQLVVVWLVRETTADQCRGVGVPQLHRASRSAASASPAARPLPCWRWITALRGRGARGAGGGTRNPERSLRRRVVLDSSGEDATDEVVERAARHHAVGCRAGLAPSISRPVELMVAGFVRCQVGT